MKRTIDFHLNDQRKKANLYRAIKNDLDNNDSSSDEEPINSGGADLYPLSHYANDPEQLTQQLFSVVRGKRLARLVPPELKHLPFEELKADCLMQLLCMSKKRVLATLEGKEMNSSSDSDDSVDNQRKQMLKAEKREETAQKRAHKEKKIKKKKKVESESEYEKSEEKEGKTLLEILELEMKAKAIRALLAPGEQDNDTQLEEAIKNEIVTEKTNNDDHVEDKSWSERYEEREDVREVVKTSKLCTNMRRRMLLYQQKMLADRAKLKADETSCSKIDKNALNNSEPKEKSNDAVVESSATRCDENTVQNIGHDNIREMKMVHEDGIVIIEKKSVIGSNNCDVKSNTRESSDEKSADLENIVNEFPEKNCDLQEKLNGGSKKNEAQRDSDVESTVDNFSVGNNDVD